MMSISESNHEDETEEDSDENLNQDIPDEFQDLYKDEELRKTLVSSLKYRIQIAQKIFRKTMLDLKFKFPAKNTLLLLAGNLS